MKELHANPEALKALVEKVNSGILVYLINYKSALLVLITVQNNVEAILQYEYCNEGLKKKVFRHDKET